MEAIMREGRFEIPELDIAVRDLRVQIAELRTQVIPTAVVKYLTLRDSCRIKGVSYESVRKDPLRQPWIGFTPYRSGRVKYWPVSIVEDWCGIFDDQLSEYIVRLLHRLPDPSGFKPYVKDLERRGIGSKLFWQKIWEAT